jgi:hypothetical protein
MALKGGIFTAGLEMFEWGTMAVRGEERPGRRFFAALRMTRRELNAEARRTQRDSHSASLRAGSRLRDATCAALRYARGGSMTRRELNAEERRTKRDSHSASLRAGSRLRCRSAPLGYAPFIEPFRASKAGSMTTQRRESGVEPPHSKDRGEQQIPRCARDDITKRREIPIRLRSGQALDFGTRHAPRKGIRDRKNVLRARKCKSVASLRSPRLRSGQAP